MSRISAVTGASRGIGRATAMELARGGDRVFALGRSESDLRELAAEAQQSGLDVIPLVMDVTDEASRRSASSSIMQTTAGHGLDLLVNNAGYGQMGPLEEVTAEQLRRQLEVNVIGVLAFTQPFLPGMRARRQGAIVNVSSVAGRVVAPFGGAYSASKFALEAISDALRLELSAFGVHVILIEPGPIRTAFRDVALATAIHDPASPYADLLRRFEHGRKGWYLFEHSPESVARTIARAARSRHPRARYTVTIPAKVTAVARRLVPDWVTDAVLLRTMRSRDR
jgi:NAD(P)-dependent dehydrogenase (short-subunit alcohol dehydrogenase family)